MIEIVKDWWGLIVALLSGAVWVGKIQRDVQALQEERFVTMERCDERRGDIKKTTELQFANGNIQFTEIKVMVVKLQDSHNKLIELLLEGRNR